jgi:hypothetical protein
MILPNDLRGELEILAKFGNEEAQLMLNACKVIHGIQLEFDK